MEGRGLYAYALFLIIKINNMEEKEVPLAIQKRLVDIMLDNPTLISTGNKQYKIKDLSKYSAMKICDLFLECKTTEDGLENVLEEFATNMRYVSKVVAVILLNNTFTDDEDHNELLIKKMTTKILLESTTNDDFSPIILQAVTSMNINDVFQCTELTKYIATMVRKRKVMTKQ